jgi:gastric triacylglycerol lipase
MTFIEMVKSHGYPVWSKFIETPDSYILNIFRIPGKKGESLADAMVNAQVREPIVMLHGIMSSSECFILNGPDIAPAY